MPRSLSDSEAESACASADGETDAMPCIPPFPVGPGDGESEEFVFQETYSVFILPAVYRCSNIDGSYDASVSYKSDLLQAEETNH